MNNNQMDKNYMQVFFADAKGVSRLLCGLMLAMAAGWSAAQGQMPAAAQPVGATGTPVADSIQNASGSQIQARSQGQSEVQPAAAQPVPGGQMSRARFDELEARAPLNQRYPAGTIKSGETAQKALDEAAEDRQAVGLRYILDQRDCYKKFMVSNCLEAAKDRKRIAEKNIKQVENEANVYQRQATVDERDRSLAEQHAKDEEDAARRLQEQKQKEIDSARKVQESNAKNREVQQRIDQNKDVPADLRVREHDAKIQQQQAEEAARAPERAANAAARQQRIKDAEAHRLDVERKKAENEREHAERKKNQQQDSPTTAPAAK
ncbi:MAG: hypothetical protein GAK35_01700 [Herbaspirillum frisingense]|uniref:Colicin transporter n=1 Tax=Herbaspirillum frisingense TaxID=92645 RepID=A0A7V8FXN3_9BURK|nr:MAG: hypothetical protein GAK35_01700 [Herbaspirillum frisingense]